MFSVSDRVVYPGHGVAVITRIVNKAINETTVAFLELTFMFKDMIILLPESKAMVSGMRGLSSKAQVEEAFEELRREFRGIELTAVGWSKRHKECQLRIQQGSLKDVACIYRNLMYISKNKELSFGEKALVATSEDLLAQEIAVIYPELSSEEILKTIRKPFEHLSYRVTSRKERSGQFAI